jgi:hypothetical protein
MWTNYSSNNGRTSLKICFCAILHKIRLTSLPPGGDNSKYGGHQAGEGFLCVALSACKTVTTVQHNFRRRFGKDHPTRKSIYYWHRKFETIGCLCKGKSPGRPRVSEKNVQRIRQAFLRSPKTLIPKASRELQIPQTTVWKVLRKHLFTSFVKTLYHKIGQWA